MFVWQGCLTVESDRTVVTNAPKDSHFFKNMTRGLCKTTTKYTFSNIFNENTSQKDFFSSTMLSYVKDFIDGQNCLVFTYGVTSSGKTYTIQGNWVAAQFCQHTGHGNSTLPISLTSSFGCRTSGNFVICCVFFLLLPYTMICRTSSNLIIFVA